MTAHSRDDFPVLSVALSGRGIGLALLAKPLQLNAAACWESRKGSVGVDARLQRLASEPQRVLVTHATLWHRAPSATDVAGLHVETECQFISVEDACRTLESEPTPSAIAERLIDAYPELSGRLERFLQAPGRTDRIRYAQPLLAALTVAHAASVEHLMKHG